MVIFSKPASSPSGDDFARRSGDETTRNGRQPSFSMADPVLTSLCSICHREPPRYKCPRCQLRTCSAACVKKHKAWSECNGERDATAYVPRSRLRTINGVNNDYNFLHKMDLSLERAERLIVDDRALVQRRELRPQLQAPQVRWKTDRDGRTRQVLVPGSRGENAGARPLGRLLAARLRQLDVHVVRAPAGMARHKENDTTFNRRTGGVNWRVEWLAWFSGQPAGSTSQTTRSMSKVLEDVPLYLAYQSMRTDTTRPGRGRMAEARLCARPTAAQSSQNSTWNADGDALQDPVTGHWIAYHGPSVGESWPREDNEAEQRRFRFFLGDPPTGSGLATTLTPVISTDCLRDVLAGTRVREFPTLYVLPAGEAIPAGFVLGPKDKEAVALRPGAKRRGTAPSVDGPEGRVSNKRMRRLDGAAGRVSNKRMRRLDGAAGRGIGVGVEEEDSASSTSGSSTSSCPTDDDDEPDRL